MGNNWRRLQDRKSWSNYHQYSFLFTSKTSAMAEELIIRTMLQYDDDFALTCLLKLYKLQEADEQDVQDAMHRNGVGFNKSDAPLLSMYAREALQGNKFNEAAMSHLHELLPKYAKQLSRYLTEEDMG
jgi:hypothetical protein